MKLASPERHRGAATASSRLVGGSVLQLCRTSYAVRSAFLATATRLVSSARVSRKHLTWMSVRRSISWCMLFSYCDSVSLACSTSDAAIDVQTKQVICKIFCDRATHASSCPWRLNHTWSNPSSGSWNILCCWGSWWSWPRRTLMNTAISQVAMIFIELTRD